MWAWTSGSARRRPAPHAARRKVTHEVNTSRRPTGEGAKPPPVHWGTTHPALKTRRGKTHGPRGGLVRGVGPKMPIPSRDASPAAPQLKPPAAYDSVGRARTTGERPAYMVIDGFEGPRAAHRGTRDPARPCPPGLVVRGGPPAPAARGRPAGPAGAPPPTFRVPTSDMQQLFTIVTA
jgi:hypothetical protein